MGLQRVVLRNVKPVVERMRFFMAGTWSLSLTPRGGAFHEQDPVSRRRAMLRLRSLDEESQERIAKQDYHGFRPWQEARQDAGERR